MAGLRHTAISLRADHNVYKNVAQLKLLFHAQRCKVLKPYITEAKPMPQVVRIQPKPKLLNRGFSDFLTLPTCRLTQMSRDNKACR